MIKINTDLFDWDIIQKIYTNQTGDILPNLRDSIFRHLKPGGNQIVQQLLARWFLDSDNNLSDDKIVDFLLNKHPDEQIDIFFKILCKALWQDENLAHTLKIWSTVKREALETNDKKVRKEKITSVINYNTIHMFTGIDVSDLNKKPKNGTVYANKEKVKKITISRQDEINTVTTELKEIFDYELLKRKDRDKLLDAMHISVCPYCNRQFITSFEKNGKIRSTADIDHFYSKDLYPFLALSLYNLVPSCQICNSRFKLTTDFYQIPHINPYKRGFSDDGRFKLINIDSLVCNKTVDPNYEIVNLSSNKEDKIAIDNSINTFQLNNVYKIHKDYVRELLYKVKMYSDKQLEEYLKNFEHLFSGKEEMQQALYGTYLHYEDVGKRPLAKLTYDILSDLGIKLE